jgi:hypothetical protein
MIQPNCRHYAAGLTKYAICWPAMKSATTIRAIALSKHRGCSGSGTCGLLRQVYMFPLNEYPH